jgi:hypothetical protein
MGAEDETMTRGEARAGERREEASRFLRALVEEVAEAVEVRKVVLLDRAGRVLARHGVEDRAELTRLASLSAGLHATSARIAELAEDPGRSVLHLETDAGRILLIPLPVPSTCLVLLVLQPEVGPLPERVVQLLEELAWVDSPGWTVTDPLRFEDSLTRSLDDATTLPTALPSEGEPDPAPGERS